jgi:hypothetical protein
MLHVYYDAANVRSVTRLLPRNEIFGVCNTPKISFRGTTEHTTGVLYYTNPWLCVMSPPPTRCLSARACEKVFEGRKFNISEAWTLGPGSRLQIGSQILLMGHEDAEYWRKSPDLNGQNMYCCYVCGLQGQCDLGSWIVEKNVRELVV